MAEKVVFIDRDDTICINVPYCSNPDDLVLREGAGESLFRLKENNFKLILITNQSGISRGYFTNEVLNQIHLKMQKDLSKFNVEFNDIFYCSCLPKDNCPNRKPGIGMFTQASKKYNIDISKSYMVGDMESDIIAGQNFGLKTILVYKKENSGKEDFFAKSITDAADYIIDN